MSADSDLRERLTNGMRITFERLAGEYASEMLKSESASQSFLAHPNPDVRQAALFALKNHWKSTERLTECCERMVFDDNDVKVRSLALATLAGCYINSNDRKVGEFAARIALDQNQPEALRFTAYRVLSMIRQTPITDSLILYSDEFRFPEDVDWNFVNSFL